MDYARNAQEVAQDLVGMVLDVNGQYAEIVETEAYEGGEQTARRGCMRLAPGQIGVMPYRGLYFLNIGTEAAGTPSCVLVRAVQVEGELVDGPGKVGKRLDARSLELQVLGKDIPVSGQTKPSDFVPAQAERSGNSLGRYRLR